MTATIYYFSATGNSLSVARELVAQLDNARLVPIARAMREPVPDSSDIVGIVYPVYMFGLPLIVRDFFAALKVRSGAYVFGVATLGGLPGRPHSQARAILKVRGIELAAGFSVLMPGNYTPLYGAISHERQQKMFAKCRIKVTAIANAVRSRQRLALEEKPFLANFLLNALLYRGGSAQIPLSGQKGFRVDESCTKCGLCAKVCPVSNIHFDSSGRPTWLNHCQSCMACLQWCPVEAIQYKTLTKGRKRYHHPDISAQDIMISGI
jgi:ferredoxin